MSRIVCDASPLIFLAKLDRLSLVADVLEGEILVTACVAAELRANPSLPLESARIEAFLRTVTVVDAPEPDYPSRSLSRCDRQTLTYAVRTKADWLVADERLLRRVAVGEGLRVIGILGLIVRATRKRILGPEDARDLVASAVSVHGMRLSIRLYQDVMAELARIRG